MSEDTQTYPETYRIGPGGNTITCLRCGLVSHNPRDVEEKFCGNCCMFHEDVWPPAREWWMAHPDESALGLRLFMVNAELNKTRFLLQSVFTARAWTGIDVATLLEKDKPELCQQVREMLRLNGG